MLVKDHPPMSRVANVEGCRGANKVFAIPEMLELILSFLTFQDLHLAQAVSKTFKTAIGASRKLQQALYFIPDKNGTLSPFDSILPIFPKCLRPSDLKECNRADLSVWTRDGVSVFYIHMRVTNAASDGPWCAMQLSQPPVHAVSLYIFGTKTKDGGLHLEDLKVEAGITLGDLVRHTRAAASAAAAQGDGWYPDERNWAHVEGTFKR